MNEIAKELSPEEEGKVSMKIMQDCFLSFGLSMKEANEKIAALVVKMQESQGRFRFFRIRDVIYTAEVTGKNQVELHAIPGGKAKQNLKYRLKKLEDTLPNILAVMDQLAVSVVYVTMPKKSAPPYDELMETLGFTKTDIPEDTGAIDQIAYIARLR